MLAILALASCPRWNCLDSQYLLYLWRAEEFVRKLADYVDGLHMRYAFRHLSGQRTDQQVRHRQLVAWLSSRSSFSYHSCPS